MVTPRISVVVPVHNGAKWLGETLQSLYQQTEPDFEILLVDDASTDDLQTVLAQNPDQRLQVLHLPKNVGVSAARNHGISLAQAPYVAFCDADDLCMPYRLAQQLSFLEQHPQISLCGSAFECFDEVARGTVSHPTDPAQIRHALMAGNCFGLSTVMVRRAALNECRFDERLHAAEDYDLWCRLAAHGMLLANLPDVLVRYRLHPEQASSTRGHKLDLVSRRIRALFAAQSLGDAELIHRLESGVISFEDLIRAGQLIQTHCMTNHALSPRDYRYFMAWMYQSLPTHGLGVCCKWLSLASKLGLLLDWNYRVNIVVLSLLPAKLKRRHFDVLIKLKR